MPHYRRYRCDFMFQGRLHVSYADDGIDGFIHGFWVDESIKPTADPDAIKYWIPPHKIERIVAETLEEKNDD